MISMKKLAQSNGFIPLVGIGLLGLAWVAAWGIDWWESLTPNQYSVGNPDNGLIFVPEGKTAPRGQYAEIKIESWQGVYPDILLVYGVPKTEVVGGSIYVPESLIKIQQERAWELSQEALAKNPQLSYEDFRAELEETGDFTYLVGLQTIFSDEEMGVPYQVVVSTDLGTEDTWTFGLQLNGQCQNVIVGSLEDVRTQIFPIDGPWSQDRALFYGTPGLFLTSNIDMKALPQEIEVCPKHM